MIGTGIGVVGGAVGTYFSIRNTRGPGERAFIMRAAAALWVFVVAFVMLQLLASPAGKVLLWIAYAVALPMIIVWINRSQARIRRTE